MGLTRAELVQGFGLVLVVVAFAWLIGAWFLLGLGCALIALPELLAWHSARVRAQITSEPKAEGVAR